MSSRDVGASLKGPDRRTNKQNQFDADDEDDRDEKQGQKANHSEPKEGAASLQHPQKQSVSKEDQKKSPTNVAEQREGLADQN